MTDVKEYVKLWVSYEAYFEPLDEAEIGRLVCAMILYKKDGTEPTLGGNESILWPAIKRDIDMASAAQAQLSESRRKSGKKGGQRRSENLAAAGKAKQNKQTLPSPSKTSHGQGHGQGQGQGQGQGHGHGYGKGKGQRKKKAASPKEKRGKERFVCH